MLTLLTTRSYEFESFRLDPVKRLLLRGDERVPLAPKAFDTLLLLVERHGQVLEKDELMKALWPDSFVEEANLTVNISVLRKALGERLHQHRYIVTVPGRGYRFVAGVTELADEDADVLVERTRAQLVIEEQEEKREVQTVIPGPSTAETPRLTSRQRPPRTIALVSTCVALVLIAGGLLLNRNRTASVAAEPAPVRSVAVLPLKNLMADPTDEYFSDGMTESLITALSKIDGLTVISGGSVFRFKGMEIDPREAGKQLGVAAVLEGNVRKSADSVRVTVRLVSVADGRVLWANDTRDRTLGDIFALQDEIARNLAEGLKIELSSERRRQLSRRYTASVEAYEHYFRGRFFWNKRTAESLGKAIEHFDQAVKLDPNYAPAYAGLADSYALLNFYGSSRQEEVFPKARAAAERALMLDDTLAETHTTLAYIKHTYEWDWAGAERGFKRAIELNPNYETAHQWYSEFLTGLERFDEAVVEIEKAHDLSPYSLVINSQRAAPYFFSRRYDEAIARYLRVREMDPKFPLATYGLALSYEQQGKFDESIAEFHTAIKQFGSGFGIGPLGHAYALSGRKAEARALLQGMLAKSKQSYVSPYRIALVYAGLNEKDQAFDWLQKAVDDRDERLVRVKIDPQLANLHADVRFVELLRRVGLAQ